MLTSTLSSSWVKDTIPTEGDGNCAFNAFALALTHEAVMKQLVLDKNFIQAVAVKLGVEANSEEVKQALIAKRLQDAKGVQLLLAPLLRQLVFQLSANNLQHAEQLAVLYAGKQD